MSPPREFAYAACPARIARLTIGSFIPRRLRRLYLPRAMLVLLLRPDPLVRRLVPRRFRPAPARDFPRLRRCCHRQSGFDGPQALPFRAIYVPHVLLTLALLPPVACATIEEARWMMLRSQGCSR